MRTALIAVPLLWAAGCSCTGNDPRCSVENCKRLIDECRIEFDSYSTRCLTTNKLPDHNLLFEYCAQACNIQGMGPVAQCLVDKADQCADGGYRTFITVAETCWMSRRVPEKRCEQGCFADRTTCDDKCTGGKACDDCFRAGRSCPDLCPDAGFVACADCSTRCMQTYYDCANHCPQQ